MNRKMIVSTALFIIASINGMEEPPKRRDPLLIPISGSQMEELQFPTEDPSEDLAEFLGMVGGMSDLKGKIIKEKIARRLNPDTLRLSSLNPKLARTTSKDLQEFFCQSTILDGIYRFDQAQEKLRKMHLTQNSLVSNIEEHDQYIDVENQELEALCVFITAYEKECFDAFNYIIPTLSTILLVEKKRKEMRGSNYAMSSKLLGYRDRLIRITQTEEGRKKSRRLEAPTKKIEPDVNKAGEYYAQAQKTLSLARDYERRIVHNRQFQLTAASYCDLDALYCMAVKKIIKSFHFQPSQEEKIRIFKEIQDHFNIIQHCQRKQVEMGYQSPGSTMFDEIRGFLAYNAREYENPEPQQPGPLAPPRESQKNIFEKLLALIKKPFTKE